MRAVLAYGTEKTVKKMCYHWTMVFDFFATITSSEQSLPGHFEDFRVRWNNTDN
jgi:hypothetical protein